MKRTRRREVVAMPLDGVRVLDLSKVLAGPLCAQYLGDLGAEISKVEAVGQGDETRGWPPFPAPGLGTVYLSANRNKRSIAIDMKSEKGRKLVHDPARSADVAIESFGTGVAERLAIDADSLRALDDRRRGRRLYPQPHFADRPDDGRARFQRHPGVPAGAGEIGQGRVDPGVAVRHRARPSGLQSANVLGT